MRKLTHILFWSVIAAAFIGPGTVTTSASAGARYGLSLLWALAFSTFATLVLQEASARVTVASGGDLGQAIRARFHGGAVGALVLLLVVGAIILGCAAYEAGNILGGVAGARLRVPVSRTAATMVVGAVAAVILFAGSTRGVARLLGGVVAVMGVAFLATAVLMKPSPGAVFGGTVVPSLPAGSSLLVLGLIGTTVVPYNLFLGSGIAAGQDLRDVRFGLAVAVILGGVISMGIVVVGSAIDGAFSFDALAGTLETKLGGWAAALLALGLFAAGLSSAITAPLAAAITARGLFAGTGENAGGWDERSWRYRAVWLGVLATGVVFGVADVRPIPVIIAAQALNGILLPFVAVFLFVIVNDRALMGNDGINGALANTLTAIVVAVTIVLGVSKTIGAFASALDVSSPGEGTLLWIATGVTVVLAVPVGRAAARRRHTTD